MHCCIFQNLNKNFGNNGSLGIFGENINNWITIEENIDFEYIFASYSTGYCNIGNCDLRDEICTILESKSLFLIANLCGFMELIPETQPSFQ